MFIRFSILLLFICLSGDLLAQEKSDNTESKVYGDWIHQDMKLDRVPGTSLVKAYKDFLINTQGEEIIVAVLDMSVDIQHKYLRSHIWINKNEIPNNNIDDDQNGYIDDIHGWNYLGNTKGDNLKFSQLEYTRIIKELENKKSSLGYQDSIVLVKAKEAYQMKVKRAHEDLEYADMIIENRTSADIFIKKFLNRTEYSIADLDSLRKNYPKNKELDTAALKMTFFLKYDFNPESNRIRKENAIQQFEVLLNSDYPERDIIGDLSHNILSKGYGNPNVSAKMNVLNHGTLVSGMLTTSHLFKEDSLDIFKNIKIMPLKVAVYGDEHDKDIALAIRYAVDNGAKIINMSFGKEFSLKKQWIDEAFKYAETHDVLIVTSAGNDKLNIDIPVNEKFPNDINEGREFVNNFVMVGATSYTLDKNFLYPRTNYGENNVDIFAPGHKVTTFLPEDKIAYNRSGTSYAAPIVSGIAALIRSYYPTLTAPEVKQILMDSSVKYDILVDVPTKENPEQQLPFSELSKSGGIVNAYNALLMAEQVVKGKE